MWWNILIIPSGYRYKVMLGDGNLNEMASEYKDIECHAKVKYVFTAGEHPNSRYGNKELDKEISDGRAVFSKKYNSMLVPDKIIGMIKSTEVDHLDIIVELDVNDQESFSRAYDSGEQGAIDILEDNNDLMLVRSSWPDIKSKIESDYRFNKLSDEGKKMALARASGESRAQDAIVVVSWVNRLKTSLKNKNKNKKSAPSSGFASVFDGLK